MSQVFNRTGISDRVERGGRSVRPQAEPRCGFLQSLIMLVIIFPYTQVTFNSFPRFTRAVVKNNTVATFIVIVYVMI